MDRRMRDKSAPVIRIRRWYPAAGALGVAVTLLTLAMTAGCSRAGGAAAGGPIVSVSGTSVALDGRPVVLFGLSYFGALDASSIREADLDAAKGWGINTVRVWAHWHTPIYQKDGALTEQGRARLVRLIEALRARALVLELVLLRPGQLPGQPFAAFDSESARLRAVREITAALRDYRNVLFDLCNEHDHPDGPMSHAAARSLRDAVKTIDPARIVTISSTGGHLISGESRVGDAEARNLREEAARDAGSVGVDVLAPHFPRTSDWSEATGRRVSAVRAALTVIGTSPPIYLNEEQ